MIKSIGSEKIDKQLNPSYLTTFKNAVQYVKAASDFASSKGDDVARYVNGAGKVLVYNKATNEFATHTGKIIHTYFKPQKGFDYVKDVIKRDGYKLIQ